MTDDELRLRELELELALRQREGRVEGMTHRPGPRPIEAGTARGVGAGALMGPSKTMAGGIDLAEEAAQQGIGPGLLPTAILQGARALGIKRLEAPKLAPKVQDLENLIAGGSTEGQILPAMASGATGSLLFPGGKVLNMASGAGSAGAGELARSAGAGRGGQTAASLVGGASTSGLAEALRRLVKPQLAAQTIRQQVGALTPEQLKAAREASIVQSKVGLNPMAWQSTGEETGLRQLGLQAGKLPSSERIQARVQEQLPRANQGLAIQLSSPEWDAIKRAPVQSDLAKTLRDRTRQITDEYQFQPGGPRDQFVQATADRFGEVVPGKAAPPATPTGHIAEAIEQAKRRAAQATPPRFKPKVETLGHVEDIRQTLKTAGENITPDAAIRMQVKKIIVEEAPAEHKAALAHYRQLRDAIEDVGLTAQATAGKNVRLGLTSEHTPMEPLAIRIAGPVYRAYRFAREIRPGLTAKEYDRLLVMELNELIKELEKGRGRMAGAAASAVGASLQDQQEQ